MRALAPLVLGSILCAAGCGRSDELETPYGTISPETVDAVESEADHVGDEAGARSGAAVREGAAVRAPDDGRAP